MHGKGLCGVSEQVYGQVKTAMGSGVCGSYDADIFWVGFFFTEGTQGFGEANSKRILFGNFVIKVSFCGGNKHELLCEVLWGLFLFTKVCKLCECIGDLPCRGCAKEVYLCEVNRAVF